jgi:hypothetical protein
MDLIKDFGEFERQGTIFLGNVKEVWAHATKLGLSAVHHYVDTKDPEWVAHLMNTFLEAKGDFSQCFEAMVYATTNLKFRQDAENLESRVGCKSRGNMPDGFASILLTIETEGLNRYQKAVKSKRRAATWNADGARQQSNKQSTAADITNLQTTDIGKSMVDAASQAAGLPEDKKAQAQALVDNLNAQMAALADGKDVVVPVVEDGSKEPTGSGHPDFSAPVFTKDPEVNKALAESLELIKALAELPEELVNKRHLTGKAAALGIINGLKNGASDSLEAFQKITAAMHSAAAA